MVIFPNMVLEVGTFGETQFNKQRNHLTNMGREPTLCQAKYQSEEIRPRV